MAKVSMSLIKELREQTGTGVADCKAALQEADGDIKKAYEVLRTKGLASAAKKAGRVATEGLVGICRSADLRGACIVEVNSETDFVSRNEAFVALVRGIAAVGEQHKANDVEALKNMPMGDGTVQDAVTAMIAKMGENITLRRTAFLEASGGVVSSYIHTQSAEGLGRMGVLVALEADTAHTEALDALGSRVAMHVAAASPTFLDRTTVDTTALDQEKALLGEQARAAGKAEKFVEKIVAGRLNKYYQDVCLMDQTFLAAGDGDAMSTTKFLAAEAKALQCAAVAPAAFVRFNCGEGIDKEEGMDYATEVAAMAAAGTA